MKNPYTLLDVGQNSDNKEINTAKIKAIREKKYSLVEIASAAQQLLNPSKRLAADFMFPAKIKAKRPQKIKIETIEQVFDIQDIDDNYFDSIK